jgi:hypothetical protein
MGSIKQFFSDLAAIFLIGIGISTTRTKQRRLDLQKLVSNAGRGYEESRGDVESEGPGERWILINRAASIGEYKNQRAVMFDSRPGKGLAWVEGLRFTTGKIDLKIAAVPQDAGIAFHVRNEREFEAVCFHVGEEARNESESQRVVLQYISTYPDRYASHEAQFDLPYSRSGEWFKARISISKQVIAVFIDGDNLPALSVEASSGGETYGSAGGSVGLWIGPASSALVSDFRIHVVRSNIEKQIRSIFSR